MKTKPYRKVGTSGRVRLDLTGKKHCYTIYARAEQLDRFLDRWGNFSKDAFFNCLDLFRQGEHLKYTNRRNHQLDNVRVHQWANPDYAERKEAEIAADDALIAKLHAARLQVLKDRAEKQARRERGEIKPLLVLTGHNGEWVEGKLAGHYGVALTPRK